jgi:hypothetical protein
MSRRPDPIITDTLKQFGFDRSAMWDCHGVWVVYHRVLEQIAAKAGVRFDPPMVVEANGKDKIAAICVTGTYGDKTEWSIGEAAPNNNKNAYPWAMAEKRAKDRVILKLIGLHGLAYSEDEADDFKQRVEEEADHRTPEAILNDFMDRAKNLEVGNRAEFEFAWKEEMTDLKRIQRNAPELYNEFTRELHKVLAERKLDQQGSSRDAPETGGQREDSASGGDSPARTKAREFYAAWKAAPHLTALETSMKQAGWLSTGEDGWIVRAGSHLEAIRDGDREAFDALAANVGKLQAKLRKEMA